MMESIKYKPCSVSYIILFINIWSACGIWPPPYSVNLSHEETFVISEPLEDKDVQDVYDEEEMIRKEDLAERENNDKYFRIHNRVRKYNDRIGDGGSYNKDKVKVFEEYNPDIEEPVPWEAGFVDENGKFRPDEDVVYFDGEPHNNFDNIKQRRSDEEPKRKNDSINYDYKSLKADYENFLQSAQTSNDTLKFSTVKEDESVKDSLKEMVDFKSKPKNCTAEEMKGIGLGAARCFWMELEKPRMKSSVFEKAIRMVIIWVVLYVVVAIPCWCQYGWGCCCCRFKFCRPRENIMEVQQFFAQNPVGVYRDEKGNVFNYKPTSYEKYAYKKLEQQLGKL